MSKQELREGFTEIFGDKFKNSEEIFDRIIAEVDLDGSGEISYNEFTVAVLEKENVVERKRLEEVFKTIDVNHNGLIDSEELRDSLSRFTFTGDSFQEYIKECDTNADGFIDIVEFIRIMSQD